MKKIICTLLVLMFISTNILALSIEQLIPYKNQLVIIRVESLLGASYFVGYILDFIKSQIGKDIYDEAVFQKINGEVIGVITDTITYIKKEERYKQ